MSINVTTTNKNILQMSYTRVTEQVAFQRYPVEDIHCPYVVHAQTYIRQSGF